MAARHVRFPVIHKKKYFLHLHLILQSALRNLPCRALTKRLTIAITKRGAIEDVLLALLQSQYRLRYLAATADGSPSWQQSDGRRRCWQGRAVSATHASCTDHRAVLFSELSSAVASAWHGKRCSHTVCIEQRLWSDVAHMLQSRTEHKVMGFLG